MRDELWAAGFNEIAGLRKDVLQKFKKVAESRFLIDRFGDALTMSRVGLHLRSGLQGAGGGLVLCAWGHESMLRLHVPKCKGHVRDAW